MFPSIFQKDARQETQRGVEMGERAVASLLEKALRIPSWKILAVNAAVLLGMSPKLRHDQNFAHVVHQAIELGSPHLTPEAQQRLDSLTRIDPHFSEAGIQPEALRRGMEGLVGAELFHANVSSVRYSAVPIPFAKNFHGAAHFVAGLCTLSNTEHARSEIVITRQAFRRGVLPLSQAAPTDEGERISPMGVAHVIAHETAHSIDDINEESMPEPLRLRLYDALGTLVTGFQTVYPYVNEYVPPAGASQAEVESALITARQEAFAEILEEGWEMDLQASPGTQHLSLTQRMTQQLALRHNIPLAEAERYGAIFRLISEWRGEAFFVQGHRAFQMLVSDIQEQTRIEDLPRQREQAIAEFSRIQLPGILLTLQRTMEGSAVIAEEHAQSAANIEALGNARGDLRNLLEELDMAGETSGRQELRRLLHQTSGLLSRIDAHHEQYLQHFTNRIHEPRLRNVFDEAIVKLGQIQQDWEYNRHTPILPELVHQHVDELHQIIERARRLPRVTDEEYDAFTHALQSWFEARQANSWERTVDHDFPQIEEILARYRVLAHRTESD